MKRITLFSLFLFVVLTGAVNADQYDSCRCRNGLATTGDTKNEVLTECGKPLKIEYGYISIRGNRTYAEKWVYNFGPNEFMQAIAFDRSNKVVTVESLGRGY